MIDVPEEAFVENTEDRCPCLLLVDVSYSMSGKKIKQLNDAMPLLFEGVTQDSLASQRVELAVASFGNDDVDLVQDFATVDACKAPSLSADGNTPMGKAIHFGLDLVQQRKDIYRANQIGYYRPWIFLITDGEPTDSWQTAAQRVHDEEAAKKMAFFAVGVDGADMNTLAQIAPASRPPVKLNGLAFADLFVWLSTSLARVSTSVAGGQVELPAVGWGTVSS